ncbi:tRNA (guanine-N(7)-)-methyltransferase [Clostridium sp. CAG:628]|jgi:tRNA (guanine-N7-)-methyltransferase|nr:tRNA (guanine-N(7)-)-methyltransferase [Clostridium sp. CAG:628]
MRLKHIKGSEEKVSLSKVVIKNPEQYKGKWKSVFNNKNKIYLEIGMGKGSFLIEHARRNKNVNYIGFEKYPSVLLNALETIENENLTNIKIICADAYKVDEIFYKEISKLYLNFSDPWPKKRHIKRRLTSDVFLKKYNSIFKGLKVIEQKTDNDELFNFSLESYKLNHYIVVKKNTNYFDDIRTEYENKFISKGKNINYVKVIKI